MITTQPTESPAITEWGPLYRMSLDRYEAMVESGLFTKEDRFELIEGYLVAKMTQGDPHSTADDLCREQVGGLLPAGWYVRSNKPVRIPPNSKPEPDHAVVRGQIRDYSRRSPEPADVTLIVEIADSSMLRNWRMGSLYGGAGIPIYWIVNLVDRAVEVFTGPYAGGYAVHETYRSGDTVPVVIDGNAVGRIAVDDLLP